ncbi:CBS domain-containing protein [Candidatus Bathyarchaeota archaeon]|jgi:CBS domain-containing protein|nr:CBS domain-containing protein [Candidatus Bathyarchaeota archaeon]
MSGMILVRDIMAKNVKTVRTDDSVHDAVVKMNKFDVGSVIVTNNNRAVGIITSKNILRRIVESRLDASTIRAKDIMSSPLITIEPDASIEDAAKLMVQKKIKKIAIIEKDKILGIISTSDIVKANPTQLGILRELLKVS